MAKKNLTAGLENVTEVVDNFAFVNYADIEALKTTTPTFPSDATSAKCKIEREPKVQDGLHALNELMPELSQTFLTLGAWWENKFARKELKNALDAEAEEKGYTSVDYMQNVLRPQVEKLENIQEAINRLLYVTTYFKPREGAKASQTKVSIDGEIYEISSRVLAELKQVHTDANELRQAVKDNGRKLVVNAVEEL